MCAHEPPPPRQTLSAPTDPHLHGCQEAAPRALEHAAKATRHKQAVQLDIVEAMSLQKWWERGGEGGEREGIRAEIS